MKRISLMVGVAALAAMNATAQLRTSLRRSAQEDIPEEVAEKIPEDCRDLVEKEIRDRASKQATAEAEKKFNILFEPSAWTNNCGKTVLLQNGGRFGMRGGMGYALYDKDGRLVQAGRRNDFEEWRWRDARQKEIFGELWKNQSVVDAVLSNAAAKVAKERRSPRRIEHERMRMEREELRRAIGCAEGRVHLELLEELIPLEEAMGLAKDGKGKGYFQLALRYAGGNELPRDSKLAYKMLCKARDADYANAVLVEGLCDEADLRTPSGYSGRASVDSAMREYCGVEFVNGRRDSDSLTNEVAFARVMGKYEKAKSLGALTATNQIAALNKRLADFNAERPEVEAKQAKEAREAEAAKQIAAMLKAEEDAATRDYDAKCRAQVKELFGYEMGERVSDVKERSNRVVPLKKPYRYFTTLRLWYIEGVLWKMNFCFDGDGKYTDKSLEEEMQAVRKDFEKRFDVRFGGMEEATKSQWTFFVWQGDGRNGSVYAGVMRMDLCDSLNEQEKERLEARKATLPAFKAK